jgi:hypothetical protein
MIIDQIPSNLSEIKTQYCIVGSGAAGITLALELEKKGFDVVILEAGNFEQKSKIADEKVLETGFPTEVEKRRFKDFGGSTEAWGGWCTPLDESDFHADEKIHYSGWPIKLSDLRPYYDRTTEILNLEYRFFENKKFFEMESEAQKIGSAFKLYQFSTPVTRFGQKYKEHISRSNKITSYLNSPVVEMQMNAQGSAVEALKVKSSTGLHKIKAKHFIFCCGSIENARLLLSFSRKNKTPIGLGHKFLGKGFMEHPNFSNVGTMMFYKKDPWSKLVGVNTNGKRDHFFFQVSEAERKKHGWLNLRFKVYDVEHPLDPVDQKFYSLYTETLKRSFHPVQEIGLSCEQFCSDKNGIVLREDADRLGLWNVNLNWELTELDWKSYTESMEFFARKLPSLGLGFMKVNKDFLERKIVPVGNSHQMGMTRMGESFKDGYVDKNLSVFGVSNLSVLGSSVFPTAGAAAPTMTITALGLRLADYLSSKG